MPRVDESKLDLSAQLTHRAMFAPEIRFSTLCPPEISALAGKLLSRVEWLIPSWCHTLHIDYDAHQPSERSNAAAQCETTIEYRKARITIYPAFLNDRDDARKRTMLHEVCHIILAPFHDCAIAEIERHYRDDKAGRERAGAQLTAAMEATVCDLEAALIRRGILDDE